MVNNRLSFLLHDIYINMHESSAWLQPEKKGFDHFLLDSDPIRYEKSFVTSQKVACPANAPKICLVGSYCMSRSHRSMRHNGIAS